MLKKAPSATGSMSLLAKALSPAEREILLKIRNRDGVSRIDLTRELGLSKAMLSKAVGKLRDFGLIQEERAQPRRGQAGQPPLVLRLAKDSLRFVGINVTTRGIDACVADPHCKPIWASETIAPAHSALDTIDQVVDLIKQALEAAGNPYCDIGLAVPALLSEKGAILEVTPWQSTIPYSEIIQAIKAEFPQSKLAYGAADLLHDALSPEHYGKVILRVGFSDGVGGQVFDRNRIFAGGFSQAGNIGALIPETGPRPSLPDLAAYLRVDYKSLDFAFLLQLQASNDKTLSDWIKDRGARLSAPFSAAVQLLNPNEIILGGDFPAGILEALIQHIDLTVHDIPRRLPLEKPRISISPILGNTARARAATALPLSKFLLGTELGA